MLPHRTPVELTSTAWFFAVTTMVVGASEVIGSADARGYRELVESIREAFNDRFFDVATASYATGSQTALAIPLWFRLVPAEHRDRVVRTLLDRIDADGGHFDTGTMGPAALENVLGEAGAAEVMYRIATQPTFQSWGQQVTRGATTV